MLDTSTQDITISDLFKGDLKLVSPPNIYFELKKIVDDQNKSMADAAFVIEKDPSLTLRLLKIVNSAFYGFPSKITSIDRAINLIGAKELQSITLSTIVIERFSELPDELLSMHDFWARSLRCALIAQGIDKHLGNEYADSAFTCGILHNIGQLVFFRRIPELAKKINTLVQQQENITDAVEIGIENDVIGFNHYQTGAAITKLWNLPEIITDSIRLHPSSEVTDSYYKIAAIIKLADCHSKLDRLFNEDDVDYLGLTSNEIGAIVDIADDKFEDIFKVFYH